VAPQRPTIECEDMPLDEAHRMSCGPRMNLLLSHALREKFQSLDNAATHMSLPEGTSPTTMKHRILRVAAELNIPVIGRKIPGGLISGAPPRKISNKPQKSPSVYAPPNVPAAPVPAATGVQSRPGSCTQSRRRLRTSTTIIHQHGGTWYGILQERFRLAV
jgi:hypothetical protein